MYDYSLPKTVKDCTKVLHNIKRIMDINYPCSDPNKSEAYGIYRKIEQFLIHAEQEHGIPTPKDKMTLAFANANLIWGSKRRKRYYIPSGSTQEYIDQIELSGKISDITTDFNDHAFECGSIIPEFGRTVHYAYAPWLLARLSPNQVIDDENTSTILLSSDYSIFALDFSNDIDFYFDLFDDEIMSDMLISFLQLIKYRKQYPEAIKAGVPKHLRKTFKKPKKNHMVLKHYLTNK